MFDGNENGDESDESVVGEAQGGEESGLKTFLSGKSLWVDDVKIPLTNEICNQMVASLLISNLNSNLFEIGGRVELTRNY